MNKKQESSINFDGNWNLNVNINNELVFSRFQFCVCSGYNYSIKMKNLLIYVCMYVFDYMI